MYEQINIKNRISTNHGNGSRIQTKPAMKSN
uniref:Uncharacterized protein n=1 Tax=Rhizophora mucronata TaxID=61149 RepID=A0A2P2P770_RHIMU